MKYYIDFEATQYTHEIISVGCVREDGETFKSYVKVKDAKGNVKTQEVVTGFSDGVNVEIVEGLEVGDVVLIESKVAGE